MRKNGEKLAVELRYASASVVYCPEKRGDVVRKARGFSLIELLIVVAIILIIAAIAIPNLIRSRIAANEASAVASVRTIGTAQFTFASTYGIGFAPLTNLGGPNPCPNPPTTNSACLIDSNLSLAPNQKSGYLFATINPGALGTASAPATSFQVTATPLAVGSTGNRYFFGDDSGVIRFNATAAAGPTDTPVQ